MITTVGFVCTVFGRLRPRIVKLGCVIGAYGRTGMSIQWPGSRYLGGRVTVRYRSPEGGWGLGTMASAKQASL